MPGQRELSNTRSLRSSTKQHRSVLNAEATILNPQPSTRPISVVKVGGSLFDLPDLRQRLEQILKSLSSQSVAIVSGGGTAADIVRGMQPVHELTDAAAHRLAMQSLAVGEALLCEIIHPSTRVASMRKAREAWLEGHIAVIDAARFVLAEKAQNEQPLDETWDATSDSIAAWVATVMRAERLILLKSLDAACWEEAAQHTDPCFGHHARTVPQIQWCNLRLTTEPTPLRGSPSRTTK